MPQAPATAVARQRHVSGVLVGALVDYVERTLGGAGVERLFARAKIGLDRRPINVDVDWLSIAETEALADAAALECGDPEIGRRAGEELLRSHEANGLAELFRSAGSVQAGFAPLVEFAGQHTAGRSFDLVFAKEGEALVLSRSHRHHRFDCGIAAGYFSLFPGWFGRQGACAEVKCQGRGDEHCAYRVVWSGGRSSEVDAGDAYREQVTRQFEQLQAIAAELTSAENVDGALRQVAARVGMAALAPRFVLVAQLADGERAHVYHSGFDDDAEADAVAAGILAGDEPRKFEIPVTVTLSARGVHGSLTALFPATGPPREADRRALAAYARYATTAIETAAELERARHDRDATAALLDLSAALVTASDAAAVALLLRDAAEAATGQPVRLWFRADSDDPSMTLLHPGPPGSELTMGADRDDQAALVSTSRGIPHWPSSSIEATGGPRSSRNADTRARLFPITARGQMLGMLEAFGDEQAGPTVASASVIDRLQAIVTQGATALDNSNLLAEMRRQANHDPLTGLLNRRAFESEAARLVGGGRGEDSVAILFLDLDRFKAVNDSLGHSVGDELLRAVARCISGVTRPQDVVARLGGDEFAIVLKGCSDRGSALVVANRLMEDFAAMPPLGPDLEVTCSIGIAVAPVDGGDLETLIAHADQAMYKDKGARRGAVR